MAQTKIESGFIGNNSVLTASIADNTITASKLADSVLALLTGSFPIGGIIMWSGSVATIPSSWRLCNGANGTPNLQDRFVVGAGSGYAVGATGGSANATLVSHSHNGTTGGQSADHSHFVPDPGHSHTLNGKNDAGGDGGGVEWNQSFDFGRGGGVNNAGTGITNTNGTSNNHTHNFTTSAEGASATNANLPPYYALAFIMRVS